MGRKFLLKTDNMSLKYLFDQPDLNVTKAIWLDFFSKENKVSDALGR